MQQGSDPAGHAIGVRSRQDGNLFEKYLKLSQIQKIFKFSNYLFDLCSAVLGPN